MRITISAPLAGHVDTPGSLHADLTDVVIGGSAASPTMTLSLPTGLSAFSAGPVQAVGITETLFVTEQILLGQVPDPVTVTGHVQDFLSGRASDDPVVLRWVSLGNTIEANPSVIVTGVPHASPAGAAPPPSTILLIDARPANTPQILLDDIDFAQVFGTATVRGGHGVHTMRGDDENQVFMLAATDTAYGGGGADVLVGGAGANLVDGGEGNDLVAGGAGSDQIDGGAGNDVLLGGASIRTDWQSMMSASGLTQFDQRLGSGDDVLRGGGGDDTLLGGDGHDTGIWAGPLANFTIQRVGDTGWRVTDLTGVEGNDLVGPDMEHLQFADMTVNLEVTAHAQLLGSAMVRSLLSLYFGFFNRVPEADGIDYWIGRVQGGQSLLSVADDFFDAGVHYGALTGYSADMSEDAFVNKALQNVMGRAFVSLSQQEKALWIEPGASKGQIMLNLLNAVEALKGDPQNSAPADLLEYRLDLAENFAVKMGLGYLSPEDSISRTIGISLAVTAQGDAQAVALIGIPAGAIEL